jgi:hypothetical protein
VTEQSRSGDQRSGRLSVTEPDLRLVQMSDLLPTVRLRCLSAEAAQEVVRRCDEAPHKGWNNQTRLDGDSVVITYADKRWPYDIAEMAQELDLASDADAARVIACL